MSAHTVDMKWLAAAFAYVDIPWEQFERVREYYLSAIYRKSQPSSELSEALSILDDIRKDVRASKFGSLQCDALETALRAYAAALAVPPAQWQRLYTAVNEMMAPLGFHGTIMARDDRVQAVMDALADIDGGTPLAAAPSAPEGKTP